MDLFEYLSMLSQVGLMFLGAIVSLNEEWAKKHRVGVLLGFAILGLVGVTASIKSANDNFVARTKLAESIESLRQSSAETARLTSLNTKLQERLVDLSKENIDTLVGGDSYCYLTFPVFNETGGFPTIVHQGKYPLYDVEARIVDLRRFQRDVDRFGPNMTLQQFTSSGIKLPIANLAPGTARAIDKTVALDQEPNLRIFFSAKNGFWEQDLLLRKINGKWLHAYRVRRVVFTGKQEKTTLLLVKVDPGFPVGADKKVEWPK